MKAIMTVSATLATHLTATVSTYMPARFSSSTTDIAPAAACIKTNTLFTGPFQTILDDFTGALGGALLAIVTVMVVALAVFAVVTITSKKSSAALKQVAMLFIIPIGLALAFVIYAVVFKVVNNAC